MTPLPYRAFVSSTFKDLRDHRAHVIRALRRAGIHVDPMEDWTAATDEPKQFSQDRVKGCDLSVLLVARRRGHRPEGEQRSITQLEYCEAKAQGLDVLVFLLSDTALWRRDFDELDTDPLIRPWRAELQEHNGVEFFGHEPSSIEIALALTRWIQEKTPASTEEPQVSPGAPHDAVRQGYLDWLRGECEKVILLGLDLRDRQNVRLGEVYVPALTARHAEPDGDETARVSPDPAERQHEPLLHRLGRESVYVPGAPGSGKSTFCRWVALAVASDGVASSAEGLPEGYAETLPSGLAGKFPFLCPLRQWASDPAWLAGNGRWMQKQLEDALTAWVKAIRPGGLTGAAFRDALAGTPSVIILDGVDEIPEQVGGHYPRRNFLTGLADALPAWTRTGHRVLLTSRSYGVEDAERRLLGRPPIVNPVAPAPAAAPSAAATRASANSTTRNRSDRTLQSSALGR